MYMLDLLNLLNSLSLEGDFNTPKENDPNFNKEVEEFETKTHKIIKEKWISNDGTQTYVRTKSITKENGKDVQLLESELKKAIKNENFEKAAELRDQIKIKKREQ